MPYNDGAKLCSSVYPVDENGVVVGSQQLLYTPFYILIVGLIDTNVLENSMVRMNGRSEGLAEGDGLGRFNALKRQSVLRL